MLMKADQQPSGPIIIKDKARSHITGGSRFSTHSKVEFEECCSLCEAELKDGTNCLRHVVTKRVLCVPCLAEIAKL